MGRLFLQLIKKKLTRLDKFPPLSYHETLNAPFLFLPLKFQKKINSENLNKQRLLKKLMERTKYRHDSSIYFTRKINIGKIMQGWWILRGRGSPVLIQNGKHPFLFFSLFLMKAYLCNTMESMLQVVLKQFFFAPNHDWGVLFSSLCFLRRSFNVGSVGLLFQKVKHHPVL